MTWSLNTNRVEYTDETKEKVKAMLPDARKIFDKEYSHAIDDPHRYEFYQGSRYYSDTRILWALESCYNEKEFNLNSSRCLNDILCGACSSDYYYKFEKQW